MAKAKVKRTSTSIDMTAMCDVSFLLLTFFILTATARQPDPLEISTPSSTVQYKLPDKGVVIVSVGKGKVFLDIVGQDVKRATLQKMGASYGVTFTEEETKRFSVLPAFGVPIGNLKQFLAMDGPQREKSNLQSGIPLDSTKNNELFNWLKEARLANGEIYGIDLNAAIKGDGKTEYPVIRKVVEVFQNQKINKFSLITSSEGGGE
ncbi:MAG: biopolymer transporter ExbD [Pedobacter sp.]|nr:MAG: biopolymer transporter ExbD [Pedobacter sp.]